MKGNCDIIECQICNQKMSFGRIKRHVSSQHNDILSIEKYINLYWSTLPLHKPCEVCNKNIVYKYKTCSKECRSQLEHGQKGKPKPEGFMSEEHKYKLSQSMKRKPGPFTGYKHSEETKQKISQNIKNIKPHLYFYGHSKETKEIMSIKKKEWYAQGNEPWTKNNKHTPETIEKIFKKRKINNLEQLVWNLLVDNNIDFTFQFFINDGKGNCKSYDFKIKDKPILIEIDGDYWHGNPDTDSHFKKVDEVKINDAFKSKLAHDKGYVLLRFWENDIKNNPKIIIDEIYNVL